MSEASLVMPDSQPNETASAHPHDAFPEAEYQSRLQTFRRNMTEDGLDACLITAPESIYYLAGLDHWGFFAYQMLIVPREGDMVLITRAMEKVTIANQVRHRARFEGFSDHEDPSELTSRVLLEMGLSGGRLALEKHSLYFPLTISEGVLSRLPDAHWVDLGRTLDAQRTIKSPLEQHYTRQAAAVSDAMMQAAIAATRDGANERDVAAQCHHAMISAGGEYTGFGPFIRPASRLGEEHTTWKDSTLTKGDALFLELSGSVRRYHAPMGRLIYIGEAPKGTREIEEVCLDAFQAVVNTITPGITADEVYQSWQHRVDTAGLSHYRRHHCGYMVGAAFPPSWCGPGVPVGLRNGSDLVLESGMVFHLLSWLMGTGRGDYFVSNSVLVTDQGCDILTASTPNGLNIV